jgi:hypothetical protein
MRRLGRSVQARGAHLRPPVRAAGAAAGAAHWRAARFEPYTAHPYRHAGTETRFSSTRFIRRDRTAAALDTAARRINTIR